MQYRPAQAPVRVLTSAFFACDVYVFSSRATRGELHPITTLRGSNLTRDVLRSENLSEKGVHEVNARRFVLVSAE